MERFVPTRTPPPLPGARILSLEAQSGLQVVEELSRGLPVESLEQLATHLPTGVSVTRALELADLKSSTFFERKRQRQPLSPEASERVYRLAKVVEAAEDYFEGKGQNVRDWLARPRKSRSAARRPEKKLEFARTAEGADYVVKLLGRLAHGIIS